MSSDHQIMNEDELKQLINIFNDTQNIDILGKIIRSIWANSNYISYKSFIIANDDFLKIIVDSVCKEYKLSFTQKPLTDAGMPNLIELLKYVTDVKIIKLPEQQLGKTLQSLFDTLEFLTNLEELDLSYNLFYKGAISHLAKQFHFIPRLKQLNIEGNFSMLIADDEDISEILDNLHNLPELQRLVLQGNEISKENRKRISEFKVKKLSIIIESINNN